ncbi:hypothetical protein ESA94_05740 [Lacibacter luteus]|uniref:Uncharacterized protein n=1 Tax=Lacibacter luteus TaxID=2508719 RepID=A0A4V1M838_9BACT|nr:hypothetical protein [Lacibacter luteus]RXK62502.1 hypothetical protein ESA94_05740 [Lacibacter luteus]
MRFALISILLILCSIANAQEFIYPSIKTTAQAIPEFVPSGWMIHDSISGDLNKDAVKDVVLVLQHKDSVKCITSDGDSVVTQPRILLILFKSKTANQFTLKTQSNSFILQHDKSIMDDPYQGLSIDRGILKIEFHLFYNMGSWYTTNSTYKFRFTGSKFILIGAELSTIHRATLEYENYSFNLLTKKQSYTKGNEQTGKKKTTVTSIELAKPVTFETFVKPFTWEIENEVYL